MQQVISRPQPNPYSNPNNSKNKSSSIIIVLALLLFALSGLMTGFATGAFTRPKVAQHQANTANQKGIPPISGTQTKTPKQTPVVQIVPLGCPETGLVASPEVADGNQSYTLTAFATDRSISTCDRNNNRVYASGITFKLWLIRRIPKDQNIDFTKNIGLLRADTLNDPITGTIRNDDAPEIQGLKFNAQTPQVQISSAQGQITWTYSIQSTIPKGDYDLLVLADWAGKTFNWSWFQIDITQAS